MDLERCVFAIVRIQLSGQSWIIPGIFGISDSLTTGKVGKPMTGVAGKYTARPRKRTLFMKPNQ